MRPGKAPSWSVTACGRQATRHAYVQYRTPQPISHQLGRVVGSCFRAARSRNNVRFWFSIGWSVGNGAKDVVPTSFGIWAEISEL
jgi:hypothetical protein